MNVPTPTPLYRLIHVGNLHVCLRRGALHAPNFTPQNGLEYTTIHNLDIQRIRKQRHIIVKGVTGERDYGVVHDYVSFYFGYLSPMLLQLKTGKVPGYTEGQEPLVYLVSAAQSVAKQGTRFVFSDGHGIAFETSWYDDLKDLSKVDWRMVYERYWAADYEKDIDRQRRKQAEFLIHEQCDWSLIEEIGVLNDRMRHSVERILAGFPRAMSRPVRIRPRWYY